MDSGDDVARFTRTRPQLQETTDLVNSGFVFAPSTGTEEGALLGFCQMKRLLLRMGLIRNRASPSAFIGKPRKPHFVHAPG